MSDGKTILLVEDDPAIAMIIRETLAEECGARSVAVILSGTGTDGSGALGSLHASGGHIIVQDPDGYLVRLVERLGERSFIPA